ncbi:MAG TPA: extracellular solute-binding protein, partial [Gaiellales bacterium]
MTREIPPESAAPRDDAAISRRHLLRNSLGAGAGLAAVPLLGATPAWAQPKRHDAADASKKLVIGAFQDGAITAFAKIIPLFKKQTGISIQLLQAPYDSFFAKGFQDGQSKAGQYDIYIMDDPWIPQYAAAGILEDLGKHGIVGDAGFAKPFIELGYWPPRQGPRVKGFENTKPALVALPTIGDLQTLTYRNDVYKTAPKTWHELVTVGQAAMKAGKIKDAYVMRGIKGNPIVTSWYPIFLSYGGQFFDNKWNVTFNNARGKAAADFFVNTLKP